MSSPPTDESFAPRFTCSLTSKKNQDFFVYTCCDVAVRAEDPSPIKFAGSVSADSACIRNAQPRPFFSS